MDIDIVSDLNDGTADHAPANSEPAHGADAVQVNNAEPAKPVAAKPEAKPADKPASIRDLISGALKGETATPEAAQQDGGRPRNPDGTFAPKPAEAAAPVDTNTPAPSAPVTAAPAGIDPAVFASLPAETQAQLARTMEDVTNRQQRIARLEPIEQLIAPRIDAWALNGMQPAQALHQLLALSDFATRDCAGFIKYIAQNNGVDLEDLVLSMAPEAPVDPQVAALKAEIAELKGVTQGFTQQQQQAAHERVVNDVIAFAEEKGQDGQPLRPYLSELGQSWLPYIGMVREQNPNWSHAQILQQAYENACWNNPGVRSKMQAAADVAANAERLRKDAEKVAAARNASASVRSGTPSAAPAAPDSPGRSVRETIRAAMAQHS